MSWGKEEATAVTLSTPETRNWGGNNNAKQFFNLGESRGKTLERGNKEEYEKEITSSLFCNDFNT